MLGEETNGVSMTPVASRVSMLIGGLNINGVSMLAVPCFLLAIRFSQPASNHPS